MNERLREAREYLGLSIEFVAESLSFDAATIYAWESGTLSPTVGELERLAGLYKVTLDYLMVGEAYAVPIDLAPRIENLNAHDASAVIRFYEFLSHAGRPKQTETERRMKAEWKR